MDKKELDGLLDVAGRREAHSIGERIRVVRKVGEWIAGIVEPLERAEAVEHIAHALDLPVTELQKTLGVRSVPRPTPSKWDGELVELLLNRLKDHPEAQQIVLDLVHQPDAEARKRNAAESKGIRAEFENRLAAGDPNAAAAFLKDYEALKNGPALRLRHRADADNDD